jgi:hypothetical protein
MCFSGMRPLELAGYCRGLLRVRGGLHRSIFVEYLSILDGHFGGGRMMKI